MISKAVLCTSISPLHRKWMVLNIGSSLEFHHHRLLILSSTNPQLHLHAKFVRGEPSEEELSQTLVPLSLSILVVIISVLIR